MGVGGGERKHWKGKWESDHKSQFGHCVISYGMFLMILSTRPTSDFHFRKITVVISVQDRLEKRKWMLRYLLGCY